MTEWFDNVIEEFSLEDGHWDPNHKGPIIDWANLFEEESLREYLSETPPHDSLEEDALKNILAIFNWFCDDASSFMQQVGKDNWFKKHPDYRENIVSKLYDYWVQVIDYYYPTQLKNIKISALVKGATKKVDPRKIKFGPWVFWSKPQWDQIQRDWDIKVRTALRSRKRSRSPSVQPLSNTISNAHNRNHHPPPPHRSRSRSRDRGKKHSRSKPHRSKSSKNRYNKSYDLLDDDESTTTSLHINPNNPQVSS